MGGNKLSKNQIKGIVLLLGIFFGIGLLCGVFIGVTYTPQKDTIIKNKFSCNPYFFGTEWSYPKQCPNSFINATGNYCNGILMCKNER